MGRKQLDSLMILGIGAVTIIVVFVTYMKSQGQEEYFSRMDSLSENFTKELKSIKASQDLYEKNNSDIIKQLESNINELIKKKESEPVPVKVIDPISINLVYRQATQKPLIPTTIPRPRSEKKQYLKDRETLLNRAGIK